MPLNVLDSRSMGAGSTLGTFGRDYKKKTIGLRHEHVLNLTYTSMVSLKILIRHSFTARLQIRSWKDRAVTSRPSCPNGNDGTKNGNTVQIACPCSIAGHLRMAERGHECLGTVDSILTPCLD